MHTKNTSEANLMHDSPAPIEREAIMKLKTNNQSLFNFHMQTQCTIGSESMDHIFSIMRSHGLHEPLWILPTEPNHKKTVKKLLESLYGKNPFATIDSEALDSTLQTDSDSTQYDCLIACGNAACIDRAKLHITQQYTGETKKEYEKVAPLALIVVPFGLLDGLECQGRIRQKGDTATLPISTPKHAVFDGRLCKKTTDKAIARTMCRSLLEICTTVLMTTDPIIRSMALLSFAQAYRSMEIVNTMSRNKQDWESCALFAGAALHAAGVCAENRGTSVIIEFTETLANEGFADYHQIAAALIPAIMQHIGKTDPTIHQSIKLTLSGEDPTEFINSWITLSEAKGVDKIISRLREDYQALLTDSNHSRELDALLEICSEQGAGE